MALFATLPYGKFAHGIFRSAALLRHAVDHRDALSAGRVEEMLAMMTDSATWWVAGNFPLSGTRDKKAWTTRSRAGSG